MTPRESAQKEAEKPEEFILDESRIYKYILPTSSCYRINSE